MRFCKHRGILTTNLYKDVTCSPGSRITGVELYSVRAVSGRRDKVQRPFLLEDIDDVRGDATMIPMKVLSKNDIMQVLEMKPIIRCVEQVYCQKSEGDTVVWPTTFYEFDPGHADMDI